MPRTASVRKKTSGKYEARYRDPDGKQRGRSFTTEKEAASFLKTVLYAKEVGDYVAPEAGRTTFGEVADAWLLSKQNLKPRTRQEYRMVLNSWLARWNARPIATIRDGDVAALMADLAARSPQTQRNVFNITRAVFTRAVRLKYVRTNPVAPYAEDLPSTVRQEQRFLTPQQVARLAGELDAPHDLLVTLAAWSGLRAGELAGLRVRRFDAARCRVEVRETVSRLGSQLVQDTPKSKKSNRVVPIPPPVARLLADHIAAHGLGSDDYVFGKDGKPLDHQSFYRFRFKPAAERVGLAGLRFHDLRHTFASLMRYHAGADLYRVSRLLGHSTVALTADTYTHLFEEEHDDLQQRMGAAFLAGHTPDTTVVPLRRTAAS